MEGMGGGIGGGGWAQIGNWMSEITDRGRDDYWKERSENQLRANMEWNAATQREFAQHGLQWRVADAVAAGVHPLYAVGASGANFAPGAQVSEGGAGDHGRGSTGQLYETGAERQAKMEQLRALRAGAERDEAQAGYYDALAAKEYQAMIGGPRTLLDDNTDGMGGNVGAGINIPSSQQYAPGNVGVVQMQGDPGYSNKSGDESFGAARRPFWSEYRIAPNLSIMLPWTQEGPGEALENIAWWMWPGILSANQAEFGEDWLRRFWKEGILRQPTQFRKMPDLSNWNDRGIRHYLGDVMAGSKYGRASRIHVPWRR